MRHLGLCLFLALVGCRGEVVNHVRLDIEPTGFACREILPDGGDEYLVARAFSAPAMTGELNVVVDYQRFDGLPGCRTSNLVAGCADDGCPTVRRDCLTMQAMDILDRIEGPVTDEAFFAAFIAHVGEQPPVTRDAPDGVVTLRVVGTTQSCDSLAAVDGVFPRFRCERLLGCAYSCPGQLDEVDGEVDIFYDTLASCGPEEVEACAALGLPGVDLQSPDTWCQP